MTNTNSFLTSDFTFILLLLKYYELSPTKYRLSEHRSIMITNKGHIKKMRIHKIQMLKYMQILEGKTTIMCKVHFRKGAPMHRKLLVCVTFVTRKKKYSENENKY